MLQPRQYGELEKQKQILIRIDSGRFGYEATSGRFIQRVSISANWMKRRRKMTKPRNIILRSVKFAEQNGPLILAIISIHSLLWEKLPNDKAIKPKPKNISTWLKEVIAERRFLQRSQKRLKNLEGRLIWKCAIYRYTRFTSFSFWLWRMLFAIPNGRHNPKYFIRQLLVKFFGAIALGLIYQFYYEGGDAY